MFTKLLHISNVLTWVFFTWPFSSRCDYIILYSYYKIEREFVVNTFNTLFCKANGVFCLYISTSSQLHCILLGRFFWLWRNHKENWSMWKFVPNMSGNMCTYIKVPGYNAYCTFCFLLHCMRDILTICSNF